MYLGCTVSAYGMVTIDFSKHDWRSQIDSIANLKIYNLTFENYKGQLDDEVLNVDVNNLTFQEGEIKQLPLFLSGKSLNYIQFSNCKFLSESIQLSLLKSLSRISFYGESINKLPTQIDDINDLTHIFISNTSISVIPLDFSKIPYLKELHLNTNKQLSSLIGDFGKCTNLMEVEIFECDNLKAIEISENRSVKRIRLGSWGPEYTIQKGLNKLLNLEIVIIDNYRSSQFSTEFLNYKPVKELKIYCPTSEHINDIKDLELIEDLGIWRQVTCSDESFLFNQLSSLKNLKRLTLNLGNLNTPNDFIEFISGIPNVKYVKLIDTKWDETEWNHALNETPKTIKLDINN